MISARRENARPGELLNLRWRDIDLATAQIHITGSAAVIAGQRIEGTTKSGRSRTISVDPGTVQALTEHRKRQAAGQLAAGPEWDRRERLRIPHRLGPAGSS